MSKKIIAVDFDGTLCQFAFPNIGDQTEDQKKLMNYLIELKEMGHKLILWTCRGDNDSRLFLTEAIEWCKERGLKFDAINKNLESINKLSGYSPKVVADIYIDDRSRFWSFNYPNNDLFEELEGILCE
jgi:hypothetical protein